MIKMNCILRDFSNGVNYARDPISVENWNILYSKV
jgi:hypothetical protein